MIEEIEPPKSTNATAATESPRLPGEIGYLENNLFFDADQREQQSGLPIITSIWKPELVARAQAVADERGVSLETVVQEWEAAWAANG